MHQFKKNPLNSVDNKTPNSAAQQSPQSIIEDKMKENIYLGNYEAAFLFSSEGLPLAQAQTRTDVDQAGMVEISLMLKEIHRTINSIADINGLKEVVVEGMNKRKVILRFFTILDQLSILAVVVAPRRTYRNLTNRLVKLVQQTMNE